MKLTKAQKAALLEWVGEGLETGEINSRASQFDPPFNVRRQQVDYYRQTRRVSMREAAGEHDALTTGLALRAERVKKLVELARLLEGDIFGDSLWVTDVKSVNNEPVYVEKFNVAEVSEYRATLDDIAKEVGDRSTRVKHSQDEDGSAIEVVHFYLPDNGRPHPGRDSHGV